MKIDLSMSDFLHRLISDIYYRRGDPYKNYRESKSTQYRPQREIHSLQLDKLRKLIQFHSGNSQYYQEIHGVSTSQFAGIRRLSDIQALPILTKDQIREMIRVDGLQRSRFTRNRSGGSTGEPTLIFSSKEHDDWHKAAVMRSYDWLGYRVGDRRMRLFTAPTRKGVKENTFKNRIKNYLANIRFVDSSRLSPELMDHIIDEINRWQPRLITGYTSVLLEIAQHLKETSRTIDHEGFVVQNAAEPLPGEQRESIENGFNAILYDHYGTREIGYIAHECRQRKGLHVNMEHLLVEIVDERGRWVEDGSLGEILITQLENFAMPVIRYRIGDLSTELDDACPCGRNLQLIGSIIGRSTDVIRLADGTIKLGLTIPHIVKDFPIDSYQSIQRSDLSVDFRIVPSKQLDSVKIEAMLKQLEGALRRALSGLEIRISVVDRISKSKSEKLRTVVSELDPFYHNTNNSPTNE